GVTGFLLPRDLPLAHFIQLLLGAVAVIGSLLCEHPANNILVAVESLCLVVRPLVRIQREPRHTVQDHLDGFLGGALPISVLDAQDELSLHAAGIQPAEKRSPDSSDVQHAGGAGSESGNDSHEAEIPLSPGG